MKRRPPVISLTLELLDDTNAVLADLVGDPLPERGGTDAVEWHNMLVDALGRKVIDGLRDHAPSSSPRLV